MSRTSKEVSVPFGYSLGNQFVSKSGYPSGGALGASVLPTRLYPVSPGAATHHVVHVTDDRVSRLEKEVAALRTELGRQNKRKQVALSSLGSEQYRLRQSIWVELDFSGDVITAHVAELEEYGSGATEYEALDDLRLALIEAYSFLLENADALGPALASQLHRFRDLVEIP